ncbi:MAG TPA: hypothetical protein VNY36_08645, partial [Bacteroidia bacterium]|nr:hypothetical protein [Bacteroidia bacterium]
MKKIFTLSVVAIVVLASCGEHNKSGNKTMAAAYSAPADWKTLGKNAFTIQYPSGWSIDTTGGGGVLFTLA